MRPNFDARAMTEVGFIRDGALALTKDEFEEQYERVSGRELTAEATGDVQGDVEEQALAELTRQLDEMEAALDGGAVLLVENEADHPKTRGRQTTVVVENENRLVFEYVIDPPLRIGVYRPR